MLLQGGRSAAHAAFLFSAYVLEATFVFAFNLDTDQVLRKDGEPGSLFGFSLAMHRQQNPDKAMVLIGAPRARALSNQKANITGGLYKCEVTLSNDCKRIIFDNDVDLTTENKENQWMGVSVKSQGPGGKIVTCAHRYQKRWHVNTPQETHYIPGRCYILSQDLTIDLQSSEDGGNWKFCDGRPESHSMFGACQQGLAATFTKDYHYMVFGAVGAYNWKGVARVEQNNSTFLDMGIFDDGPFEVGNEQVRNPEFVPVPSNSYLGFSLDSGHHITTSGKLTVVAGAPRASHSGAVVLFKKDIVAGNLSTEYILHGQGLASCFGYDVAVVDLNNDGWQDIVIGAPQFYMKGKDIGGAVYVYINEAGVWEGITPVRLNGAKDSMFGVAVENVGDINQDSYKDIAIGAPQEDSGAGKVYIYHGSAQGVKTTPAQILSGKDHNIRFFGYSLAGNMDLDGNSYPDLAVGSLSDSAIIYRTRPVISLNSVVKVSPNEISLNNKTCGDSVCFTVIACFSYKANPASYNPKLTISYVVEVDRAHRRGLTSRAMFLNDSSSELEYQFNGTLNLKEQNQQKCINLIARLKDNIKDKMRSIPIEVWADISIKKGGGKNGLPLMIPILDATEPNKVISEVNFVKEGCGSDHICQSNLKMEYSLHYKQANQEYPPLSKSKNNIPEFIVNYEKKDLAVLVTVSNMNGDDAYEAKLVGTFPNTMSYSGVRSDQTTMENPITCVANVNSSQTDCELGNPFKRNSKATFKVILSAAHLTFDTTDIEIDLQLNTTSYQEAIHVKVKCKVIIEWPLSVSGNANPTQVFFGGVVRGESAMKSEEEIGSLINFTFTINNLWKHLKPSFETSLNIYWPQIHKNGKWLLYLMSITSEGPEKISCSPKTEINPLNLAQQSSVSRTKREIMKEERKTGGKTSSLQDKKSVFSCEDGVAKCVVFKCPLQGLDGTVVVLRSRLWNSTFIEDYPSRSTLQLSVKARLEFDTRRENVILTNQNTTVSVNVSPDNEAAKHQGVPWWIILVAVLIGVLILILLVYLLWKCGFFRRPSKDQYNAAYQKAEINIQPSEKDKLSAED